MMLANNGPGLAGLAAATEEARRGDDSQLREFLRTLGETETDSSEDA